MSTFPEPSVSSALKRDASSSSVWSPTSRSRTSAQNSPKSSLLSASASIACTSIKLFRMPSSKFSWNSSSPATSSNSSSGRSSAVCSPPMAAFLVCYWVPRQSCPVAGH
eukprot:2911739-Prymnesium_polylepis.3